MNEKVEDRWDADLDEVLSKLLKPIGHLHLIQALLAPAFKFVALVILGNVCGHHGYRSTLSTMLQSAQVIALLSYGVYCIRA